MIYICAILHATSKLHSISHSGGFSHVAMNEFAKFGRAALSPFLCSHQMLAASPSQLLQMLHELLVALRGHPGHVFQEREGKFLVNPALSLFHPCEVALLNQVKKTEFLKHLALAQVLELAADYRTVASFISRHGSGGEEGMYLEAVCILGFHRFKNTQIVLEY